MMILSLAFGAILLCSQSVAAFLTNAPMAARAPRVMMKLDDVVSGGRRDDDDDSRRAFFAKIAGSAAVVAGLGVVEAPKPAYALGGGLKKVNTKLIA